MAHSKKKCSVHPLFETILKLPVFPGSRVRLAQSLRISNTTLSANNSLSVKTRLKVVSFLTERIEELDRVRGQLVSLRDTVRRVDCDASS